MLADGRRSWLKTECQRFGRRPDLRYVQKITLGIERPAADAVNLTVAQPVGVAQPAHAGPPRRPSRNTRFVTSPTLQLDVAVLSQFLATGIAIGTVPAYLRDELGASRALTGFATTIFFISALIARPFIGRFLDRSGSRMLLVWPPMASAALIGGLHFAGSPQVVASLRFFAGAVGACFYTAALSMTSEVAEPGAQTKSVARLSIAVYLGFVIGPLIAEVLLQVGFLAAWIGAAVFHLVAGLAARKIRYPLRITTPEHNASGRIQAGRRFRRIVHPVSVAPGIALLTVAFAFSTVSAFSGDYGKNLGLTYPRTLFAAFALSVLVVRLFSGRFADKRGPFTVAIPGIILGAFGLTLAAIAPTGLVGYVAMAVIGFGSGASFPAITAIVTYRAPASERGVAVASLLMFNDLGQALAGPLAGYVADTFGWRWVFGVPAIVGCCGIVAIVWLFYRLRGSASLGGDVLLERSLPTT